MITKSDIHVKVEQCIDSEDWVWSLTDGYGGVRMDGYSSTEAEAWADGRKARDEEIERLNTPEDGASRSGLVGGIRMETWFKTNVRTGMIDELHVERSTEKYLVLAAGKIKISKHAGLGEDYFPTRKAAEEYILSEAEERYQDKLDEFNEAKENLELVRKTCQGIHSWP